jgi:acyl-CoA hydrolase
MSGPVVVAEGELDLSRWVRVGDGVVCGQACAEPTVLVDALLEQAKSIGELRLFAGLLWRDRLREALPATLKVLSYGALGQTGRVESLEVVPCHYSALPQLFAQRALPGDVALLQVAPPDARGRCSFGVAADYMADAIRHARVVIAEVNDHCPRTAGPWLDWDRIDAAVMSSCPLVEAPSVEPSELDRRIADNVAALVRDGDTIQLGIGALPEAILASLHGHRALGIHSGMISDGVLDLIEAGVITNEHKPVDTRLTVTGSVLGSTRLFQAVAEREDIYLSPTSYTHSAATLAKVGPLCAINSALEVDLSGQLGSEAAGGRRLGAVGGQVDFLRAAAAFGGTAIVALPASRIVSSLTGPVSASRADVNWVVTENGARSMRGLTDTERQAALLDLAGARAEAILV